MAIISTAMAAAEGAAAPQAGGFPGQLLVLVVFIAIFYFVLMRPQSKRAKEHRELLLSLEKNDEVVTNGGVMGKIVKVTDEVVVLNVAENVDLMFQKAAIASILPNGTLKSL